MIGDPLLKYIVLLAIVYIIISMCKGTYDHFAASTINTINTGKKRPTYK